MFGLYKAVDVGQVTLSLGIFHPILAQIEREWITPCSEQIDIS